MFRGGRSWTEWVQLEGLEGLLVGLKGPWGLRVHTVGVGVGWGGGDVTGCKGQWLAEGWGKAELAVRVTIWIGL